MATLRMSEVAKIFGVSPATVKKMIEKGDIPAMKINPKNVLIVTSELEEVVGKDRLSNLIKAYSEKLWNEIYNNGDKNND